MRGGRSRCESSNPPRDHSIHSEELNGESRQQTTKAIPETFIDVFGHKGKDKNE